jgi:uncharacterized protein YndB with AHSA1/START domain
MNLEPIHRSITVKASPERAFKVFTEGIDSWWPRAHHIGTGEMKKSIIETHKGGRCYSEQSDGTEAPWGTVLAWEPPKRVVLAWQVSPQWKFEPDLSKSSEIEVSFTPIPGGETRVDLNHHHWERHGEGVEGMYQSVGGDMGWNGLLSMFAAEAEKVTV